MCLYRPLKSRLHPQGIVQAVTLSAGIYTLLKNPTGPTLNMNTCIFLIITILLFLSVVIIL